MKFDVFRKLGEKKLANIINRLVSGESTMTVARIIQEDWGEAQALSRATLEKELTSLRGRINSGGLRYNLVPPSSSKTSADRFQIAPLGEFARLLALHTTRLEDSFKRERDQGKPSRD